MKISNALKLRLDDLRRGAIAVSDLLQNASEVDDFYIEQLEVDMWRLQKEINRLCKSPFSG